MASTWDELVQYDSRHVWHPYGPMPARSQPLPVTSARGVRLRQPDGPELIDGMSSWWAAVHGYRHPELDAAIQGQLGEMAHVMFGGLTHEPGIRLAERLIEMTPDGLEHVFFADSGSVSVEVAIKLSLQYWQARGRPGKTRLLALRGGYHGDTFGAMSVCDPVGGMHSMFAGVLPQHLFADRPPAGFDAPPQPAYLAHLEQLVAGHADELAGVIVEPVVQGAGGMHFYSPAYLRALRELCDTHGVLLILDEIATGFGRSGALFAAEHAGVSPDLMCVGKALTGGYLSLAAALCTSEVAAVVSGGEAGGLMHGPTFMANPLACAVALASTEIIQRGGWRADVPRIEGLLREHLEPARGRPGVADVRVLGAIGVIELQAPVDVAAFTATATQHGVWLRPFRNLIYTMPPYVSMDADVRQIAEAAVAASTSG
ncbi:adenosylmethionine-8-amino-7-oxononanoate aminotransferase [Frankineae bacterium MT45]|nr:adenosylmethionine-8-amino-7-oxononanoate aminotransferase [Frankineae bacterium MT45]